MIAALLLVPLVAGMVALVVRSPRLRRMMLPAVALVHAALTAAAWRWQPGPLFQGWLELDRMGLYFLSITSGLFVAASFYAVGYLGHDIRDEESEDEGLFSNHAPDAVFVSCMLFFLGTMTFVTVTRHFGLLWVAIEATTLSSAPLIYFHRSPHSLEATWKYLLICSVGIALALLGNFILAVAASVRPDSSVQAELTVSGLSALGPLLSVPWLKAAAVFLVVGYGTKMGLVPLHTWLPDAHSESPSVVSAMLSGALLNCAFLGILRVFQVCLAAGLGPFIQEMLVGFGLLSIVVAAVFIIGQRDYKRMLAYSSVEHVGILALGVGIGGTATFGAMLHAVNHSVAKGLLFLAAGNILAVYRTKSVARVHGAFRAIPVTAVLWLVGFLAITGSPPFGAFWSEFTILRGAFEQGRWLVAAITLLALGLVFVGMAGAVLGMVQGEVPEGFATGFRRENRFSTVPLIVLAAIALTLGLWIPPPLQSLLADIVRDLGGAR